VKKILAALIIGTFTFGSIGCSGDKTGAKTDIKSEIKTEGKTDVKTSVKKTD